MDDTNVLKEISEKLDKLIRLQAIMVVKNEESEQSKIELLDSLGFRPTEIARLLNKSPANVSVVLSSIRKKVAKKTEAASDQQEQTGDSSLASNQSK